MPVGLFLLVALVVLALFLDRGVGEEDSVKHIGTPPTHRT
jgi:hypothetical protein